MRKAVNTRCYWFLCGLLLAMLPSSFCTGQGLNLNDPNMGYAVANASSESASPEKQKKLKESLTHAAENYRAGRFKQAASWYQSALTLDTGRDDIRQCMNAALQMADEQTKALAQLPADPDERQKYLETSFGQASQYFKDKQYTQSSKAFYALWMAAGDFKGKTLKLYEKSLAERAAEAGAGVSAPATAAAAVAAAPVPAARPDDEPLAGATPVEVKVVAAPDEDSQPKAVMVAQAPAAEPPASGGISQIDDVTRLQVARLLHSAQELRAAGKTEEARKNALEALELWPGNKDAAVLLNDLNKQLGYNRRDMVKTYFAEANALAAEGKYDEAIARYHEVLKLDPNNQAAASSIEKVEIKRKQAGVMADVKISLEKRRELDGLIAEGMKAREQGDLKRARELWKQVLEQDPTNKMAQTWLEETKPEYERTKADLASREAAEKRSEAAEKLLGAPITIATERRIPLSEFMASLSIATPSELEYYIAEDANAMIFANLVDMPLRDVLDTVLVPRGLSWSIDKNNVITVRRSLITRVYNLSPQQMSQIRNLLDLGQLQKIIWGQSEPPAEGVSMTTDERQSLLLVSGSKVHIERIESLLPKLTAADTQQLETRYYKILRKEDGPRIKTLINSIIGSSGNTPFDQERKVITDENDLIVKDTPENLSKIEELLLDKNFIQKLHNEELDIQNFSLVPRDVENVKSDQIQAFTSRVVEAIEAFLYSQEGKSQAAKEGRHLYYDPNTMQLTITDTPTRLARVSEYIQSLPELGQKDRKEVIFLEYQVASDMAAILERVLEITASGTGAATGGESVIFRLRRGEERQWRNLRVRVVRVEPNDVQDRKDDSVELSLNTGTNVNQLTLQNLSSQYIDEYEVTARDVIASSGQPGEGTAEVQFRYVPNMLNQQNLTNTQMEQEARRQEASEELGITINSFGELNALIVRYTNPALYQDVMELVKQLDKPTKQVAIETKFVEVNESRAKEFGAELNLQGLAHGRHIDWDRQNFNTRFANDLDEFRDIFSPPIENPAFGNLIKGTTVLEGMIGGIPNLSFTLRMLEAETIINITNGPKVTAMDGQQAEFRIEQYYPRPGQVTQNSLMDVINPFEQSYQNIQLADQDEAVNQNIITAVVLRMTPEITSEKSIILNQLSAELVDFAGYMGEILTPVVQQTQQQQQNTDNFSLLAPPVASTSQNQLMFIKRKKIVTDARINNGGTIILGGWEGQRTEEATSGIPVLRNMPYFGKLLFGKAQRSANKTTLLIFLTGYLVD